MISSVDNIHFSRLVNSDPCCCSLTSEPLADQSYYGTIQVPYLLGCAEDVGVWVYSGTSQRGPSEKGTLY